MKAKRVDCGDCYEFVIIEPLNYFEKKDKPTYFCKLGKRVMFRMPKRARFQGAQDAGGWFRYCNDFQKKQNEITGSN